MAKQTKQEKTTITKAEKKDAVKALFRELLQNKPYKRTALIDETAALYTRRFPDKDTENVNDVKGRVGSVFDIMKKDGEIILDGGMYALNMKKTQETPVKEQPKNVKKEQTEGQPKKRSMKKAVAKKGDKKDDSMPVEPVLPIIPVNPNYPIDPIAPIILPVPPIEPEQPEKEEKEEAKRKRVTKAKTKPQAAEVVAEAKEEQTAVSAPKKRGRKPKSQAVETAEKQESAVAPEQVPVVTEEKVEVKTEQIVAPALKAEESVKEERQEKKPAPVFDMTLLLSEKKQDKKRETSVIGKGQEIGQKQEKQPTVSAVNQENPTTEEIKKQPQTVQAPPAEKIKKQAEKSNKTPIKTQAQPTIKTVAQKKSLKPSKAADETLKERFLKRLRSLGGEYFEYYSVYLLERYSLKNGRRLESLRISGGEHDGGIDGEIELTDKLGFRETIYIQAKNWNPDKGDEKQWIVGETLLQQFIGACVCRQSRDGKQNFRGIFMTTSRFTPEAKRLLEQMSDKVVGYDGEDVYEAAKECSFGVIQKNGEWTLDESLLSGERAFFSLY